MAARKIVVGLDGSAGSLEALRWALDHAGHGGDQSPDELCAVTAWRDPAMYVPGPTPMHTDRTEEVMRFVDRTLADALGPADAARVHRQVAEGPPAAVLLEAAADADLLVVGSRGLGGFPGLLLGSVSQHVVTHAGCPVVVVPQPRRDEHGEN